MKRFLFKAGVLIAIAFLLTSVAIADSEPLTITVFSGNPGSQPTADNKIYQLIEQQLGVRFQFEFLENDNLEEALGQIIMSGSYPDLIDGSNMTEMLENPESLVDLLPYITEEGTPNLYRHLYTDNRISELLKDDGKLYIIPNYGITYNQEITNETYGPAFFIQKQVIAWNNYVVPTTLNEYFDLLERYMAANPTNADNEAYTGFEILCEGWRNSSLLNPVQHLMGRPNDGVVLVDVDRPGFQTETFINQEYAKGYYAKLNEEYNKGIVREDTFSLTYNSYIESIESGTVLGLFDQRWNIVTAENTLKEQGKIENTFLAIPLVYDTEYTYGETVTEHYMNGSVMNKDRGFGISVSCENPERMVQLFDTLLSDEWQTILQWGIENEDYYIEDGRMKMTAEQYNHLYDEEWIRANKADALLTSIPKKEGTMDNGNAWTPSTQPEVFYDQMDEYDKAFLEACGKKTPGEFFNAPIELAPYGEAWQIDTTAIEDDYQEFLQIQTELLPEIITCSPDKLDEKWDEFIEDVSRTAEIVTEYMQGEISRITDDYNKPEKCGIHVTWTLSEEGQLTISGNGDMYNYYDHEELPWGLERDQIKKVVVENGVTRIGDYAFVGCSQLTHAVIPASIKSIGSQAFANCSALVHLELPDSLIEIGNYAFVDCEALNSITLPASLRTIGTAAFAECNLSQIVVSGTGSTTWDFFYPDPEYNDHLYHINLPSSVTKVGEGAFSYNLFPYDSPDFIVPEDLTAIGEEAFSNINARFVWLTGNIDSIDVRAFAECDNLKYIYIPSWCEVIGTDALPEQTKILTVFPYDVNKEKTNVWKYAEQHHLTIIEYENPFGGNG